MKCKFTFINKKYIKDLYSYIRNKVRAVKIVHRTTHTYEKSATVKIIEIKLMLFSITEIGNNHKDV